MDFMKEGERKEIRRLNEDLGFIKEAELIEVQMSKLKIQRKVNKCCL